MNKYYGNDNFNLQNAYDDCKQVFEGITDEESYQKADCGVVMYYANEIMYALEKALEDRPQGNLISREDLKKAIETWDKFACLPNGKLTPFYMLNKPEKDYEPYVHLRDMRNAIDNAPTVERPQGEWVKVVQNLCWHYECNQCHERPLMARLVDEDVLSNFCPNCGADMRKGGAEE